MKKNVIAVILSVVLAASSIGTAPVLAAEATAEEAVSLQQEESTEAPEETSEPTEEAETGSVSEEISEETADDEETIREIEEPGQNTETPIDETEETPEAGEEDIAGQDESSNIAGTEEQAGEIEDSTGNPSDEESTTAETASTEEAAVLEEEIEAAEENDALMAEDEEVDESGTCGDKATWTLKGTGRDLTLTISGSGEMDDYGENDNSLSPWYLNKGKIKSVVIENGITGIGNYTFYNCGNLTDIIIPNSVMRIGEGAFRQCKGLTDVTIPDGVTKIEDRVFSSCYSLSSIIIPNGVTRIGTEAFSNSYNLKSIILPDSVEKLDNFAFWGCSGLKSITISDSVKDVGTDAFEGGNIHADVYTIKDCTADQYFTSLNDGSSYVFTMHYSEIPMEGECNSGTCGDNAVWILTETDSTLTLTISGSGEMYDYGENDDSLSPWYLNKGRIKSVVIENGITGIGNYTFYNCGNLTDIIIPNSVTRIGEGAFRQCKGLTDVTIPDGVTKIEDRVFSSCYRLSSIIIPDGVTRIGTEAFSNSYNLKSIILPDSVEKLDNFAFWGCSGLKSITISDSVKDVGTDAFEGGNIHADVYTTKGCPADLYFRFLDNGYSYIFAINYFEDQTGQEAYPIGELNETGACGDKATWTLKGTGRDLTLTISGSGEMYDYGENDDSLSPWYLNKGRIKSVVIENGITGIGNYTFYNCGNLTDIIIPNSVTRIGEGAFRQCKGLTDVTIPDGVTKIEDRVFSSCYSLSSVIIPDGVTRIGTETFSNSYNLKSIILPDSVEKLDNFAFWGCSGLKSITISDSVKDVGTDAFEGGNIHADVYTTKGCPADLYFRFLDNGYSYIFTLHYPCEQLGHKFGDWTITKEATCIEAGSKERECTRCYEIETEVIPALGHTWAKDYIVDKEPTMTEAGSESIHCTVCGAIDETSIRVIPKLGFSVDAEFTLEKSAFNYTGKPITPGVTVTYNGKQLVRDKDYKVTYKNNINLGQADVDVTGIGNYTGTEHLHFTIRIGAPKKVTCTNVASGMKVSWTVVNGATRYKVYRDGKYIFTTSALEVTDKEVKYKGGTKYVYKVVATEKQFGDSEFFKTATCYRLMPVGIKSLTNPSAGKMTVTYDKSAGCYGYVVRYGLKADMSDARVITVQGQNTTSRTFGGMKKGKTYFVQVRTYKLDNGVRYYSGYCTTKMIKILK